MHLDDCLCDLRNNAVSSQHIDGCLNDVIFQHLLFDGFAMTDAALSAAGEADIVIMRLACMRRPACAAHFVLAISANEFPGKYVVEYFLLAARRLLVFFVDGVHL